LSRNAPPERETVGRKRKKKAVSAAAEPKSSSQRQYFHSVSWLPMTQEEAAFGLDSDCEVDMGWLHAEQVRMINEFEDVSARCCR
jgi:hypothetical protein